MKIGKKGIVVSVLCFLVVCLGMGNLSSQALVEEEKTNSSKEEILDSNDEETSRLLPNKTANIISDNTQSSTESSSEKLDDSNESKKKELPVLSTYSDSVGPQATTSISNWQQFVEALSDTSVDRIILANDITLSGTLQNYNSLFSANSVDMTSSTNVYLYINKAASAHAVTIDGAGQYTFDFGNLAIGFLNASVTGSGRSGWTINFENIDVLTSNYSGPFYKSSHIAASDTNTGLTGTARTNTNVSFANSAKHTRKIFDFTGYIMSFMDPNVQKISIENDIYSPEGTFRPQYFIFDPGRGTSIDPLTIGNSWTNNYSGEMNHYYYSSIQGCARKLIVEGNDNNVDFGSLVFHFYARNNTGTNGWDITFNDMTVYHGNYWGAIIYNAGGKMTMNNYYGYGPQFMEADTTDLHFSGDTHLEQVAAYTSPIRYWVVNNVRQSSLSVSKATVKDGTKLYLGSRGSNVLEISGGNFDIGDNCKVTFERGNEVTTSEGGNTNVTIRGSGMLTVGKGSIVDMVNHHSSNGTVINLQGTSGKLVVEKDAVLNVLVDNYTANGNNNPGTGTADSNNPIWMGGGAISVDGSLNIKGINMGSSNTNMVHANAASTFTINSKGTLDIQSDSTSYVQNLIYMGGTATTSTFQFSDALRVNLQKNGALSGTNNSNSGLIRSGGKLDVSVQNVYQWNYGNTDSGVDGDGESDYQYEPMSNMVLTYGGNAQPTKTTYNAMTNDTRNRFGTHFTTQTQRVLFTRIPDPSVAIHSIAHDNPNDPGSVTVYGYAIPNTYIRIWEEAKNGATSAKAKGAGDTIASPVEDASTIQDFRDNFTVQTDALGNWSYTLPVGSFTAGNIIHAYGFANLKSEEPTQVVLDKTPPTAEGITYYITKGDTLPAAEKFVKNVADTSPINTGFDYAVTNPAEAETQRNTVGTHTIKINVSDRAKDADGADAPNTAVIDATLVVYDLGYGIEGDDISIPYVDMKDLNDASLKAYILNQSDPKAFKIGNGVRTDYDKDDIIISDLGGLAAGTPPTPNSPYTVTIRVPASVTGLANDIVGTIEVTIINMNADLIVQFRDKNGNLLLDRDGDPLINTDGKVTITGRHNAGDRVDLTDTTKPTGQEIQAIIDEIETNELYKLVESPAGADNLLINYPSTTVTYTFDGVLTLYYQPSEIDFKVHEIGTNNIRVDDPDYNGDFVIWDNRQTKTKWSLKAQLDQELTHVDDTGKTIPNVIRYRKKASDPTSEFPLTAGAIEILEDMNTSNQYDLTNQWRTTDTGFRLEVPAGAVKGAGKYEAVIKWTLSAVPPTTP